MLQTHREGMEKMLKKLKRFMVVAAAAVMLSAGFATFAPKEASAHWADNQMGWAMGRGYITSDMRDSLATRQDTWLIITRAKKRAGDAFTYDYAQRYVKEMQISDGTRGTNWITRDECAAMMLQATGISSLYRNGFSYVQKYGKQYGIYDGSRGSDFATRAEVISMLHNAYYKMGL